jgi:hypothetical protein
MIRLISGVIFLYEVEVVFWGNDSKHDFGAHPIMIRKAGGRHGVFTP